MITGEAAYLEMLRNILENGTVKTDRTGTGTKSIFGNILRFKMEDGFPLLTTKKVFWKGIVHELLWFLRGETNIKSLVQNNVSLWSAWPHKHYNQKTGLNIDLKAFEDRIRADEDFAKEWGELGPVYGSQWRNWKHPRFVSIRGQNPIVAIDSIDQIAKSIDLLKTDPNSRRNIVMAWNPADIEEMAVSGLPPCHYGFQLCTRPIPQKDWFLYAEIDDRGYIDMKGGIYKLDMLVNIRSWDTFLGGPFNIASYALLLHMYAQVVNMVPGDLVISSADTHIYSNHFEQVKEQLSREPKKLPTLKMDISIKNIDDFTLDSFEIIGYDSYPAIKGIVSV